MSATHASTPFPHPQEWENAPHTLRSGKMLPIPIPAIGHHLSESVMTVLAIERTQLEPSRG
jgi:hypothetical protein